MGMACAPEEFVQSTLSAIINLTSSSSDFNNFASILHKDLSDSAMLFLMLFTENDEHECCHLLATKIEHCIDLTSKVFPKTVAGLSREEAKFQELKNI